MMLNNNRQYPTYQSTTGNGSSKTHQLPNKALLHQVVSATQSWSSQNAALGSLQPPSGANSTAWRQQQVPQSFPLRKTLSVPACFRSPTLHTPSYNTGKGTKKPSPPPTSPLLVHESPTLTAQAYSNALTSHPSSRQLNLSQWSEFGSTSETPSTPGLWSTHHASLPLKRSHSSGTALTSPLTSPVGKREAQTRQGMSPKCLSLPAMSPGSRDVGKYGNIPVPRSLLPPMSESPTRPSPKPGRNLSTPPAKKRTLRHRKLGYPETTSNNNHTQAATEEKSKVEDVKKPKKCSQRSFILPFFVFLTISAVAVIAVLLYERDNVNEGKPCSISALEEELNKKLFGQHIAKRVVLEALSGHLAETHGSAPLVMSFLGPSGVGKTFVSRLVSTFLSQSCEVHVHEFIIPHHFPHPEEAQLYREQVRHWVKGNISYSNQRHLFVFDEMEKVYPDLAEGLLSVLEEDTSNSMYIFVYSTEDLSVGKYVLEQWSKGRCRESIREDEIQDLLRQMEQVPKPSVTDSASTRSDKTAATVKQHRNIPEGHAPVNHHATMATAPPPTEEVSPEATDSDRPRLVWQGDLGGKNTDRYLVPFLPLQREHVLKCAEMKLATDGRTVVKETAQRIVDEMQFYPRDRPVFSKYGCKRLSVRVDMAKDN